MQRLYENYKLLTYPRTDSRYVSTDIVDTLKDRVKACGVGPYAKLATPILRKPIKGNSGFVDNNKVSDHHAIIPTEQLSNLSLLNDKERKIYDLVVKRFLAALYPAFEYEQITLKAKIGNEMFIAKGKTVLAQGWKEIYDHHVDDEDAKEDIVEQLLPSINKGEVLLIVNASLTKGETKPPAPFNEGTLLSAMENPVKYMSNESEALKKTIGETGGLGTVATRADVIEKLFNSFVIEKNGKNIFITAKGKQLLELVPEDLKSPTLTAQWEQKLSYISKGALNKAAFINEMKEYAKVVVRDIKNSQEQFKHDNITRNKCPQCEKFMLEVNGKRGKMFVCQDRECGYKKNISILTNARCSTCHKKLELRGEGEHQMFVCSCGYREKLSAFNNRKKQEHTQGSKGEVSRYLKDQNQGNDGPFNSAMSDAFAKLKLK